MWRPTDFGARAWAEWFAILSGALYLPIEVYALVHHATALKALMLLINVGIVAYVGYVRLVGPSGSHLPRSSSDRLG